jgi:hypothetical protein
MRIRLISGVAALAATAAVAALTAAPNLATGAEDPIKIWAHCGTVTGPHWRHAGKSGSTYRVFATAKTSVVHAVCVLAKAAVPIIAKQTYDGTNKSIRGRHGFTDCSTLPLVGLGQKAFAGQCIDDEEGDSFGWIGLGLHYPGLG